MSKKKHAAQDDSVKDKAAAAPADDTSSAEAAGEAAEASAEAAEQKTEAPAADKSSAGSDNSMMPDIGDKSGNEEELPVITAPEKKGPDMAAVLEKIKRFFTPFGVPDMLLPRFIAAYFIIAGFNIHSVRKEFNINAVYGWRDYVDKIDGKMTALFVVMIFMLLTVVYVVMPKKFKISDQSVGIGAVLFFAIETVWRSVDFPLGMGVTAISCVFIAYCADKLRTDKVSSRLPDWLSLVLALAAGGLVCWFVALTTVLRHKIFCSSCFDFGIFVQMYHSLATDLTAVTTCERDKFLSHFMIHSSYIYYILVPFYKLFPKEETLLIAQAIFAMGGIIPTYLVARRHRLHGLSLLFICLTYCFAPGLIGPCYYEFHENAFLPTLLMWLIWAVDGKKTVMIYIMSVLVCIVKEDAPLYVVCILMFYFFANKGLRKRWHGIIISGLSLAYMVFITNWLTKNGDGQMMTSSRFGLLMIDYQGGLGEVAKNVLMDPAYFFSTFISHKASLDGTNLNHKDTLTFFLEVMLPLLFLPFFTRKIHRFLLMLPFVIMNLVIGTGYGYAADIGFQYILGPSVLLIYMAILNLDDMGATKRNLFPVALGSASMIVSFTLFSNHIGYISTYKGNQDYYQQLEDMLDRIPESARVASEHNLLPHIAERDEIYCLHINDVHAEEGYLANREMYDCYVFSVNSTYDMYKPFMENDYVVFDQIPGRAIIYMTPEYYASISK